MADSKITALAALTAADPVNDMFPVVDVSDTSMAASGTTKRISVNNILSSSPTASGALTVTGLVTAGSTSITGAATVGTTLGVTGVSTFAAGTALLPALTTTGDTNTGIYYPVADTFAVTTGGTERYRVDSGGNLGLGVTPGAWNTTYKALQIAGGGNIAFSNMYGSISSNALFNTAGNDVYIANGYALRYSFGADNHQWFNAPSGTAGNTITFTQAMTLDASGRLFLGTTGIGPWDTRITLSTDAGTTKWSVGPWTGSGTNFVIAATTTSGGVYLSGTAATSWSAVSDERFKDIIEPISNAVSKINSLRAVIGKFKNDQTNTRKAFLMAQDVQSVLPEAVDASNPDRLGLAYSEVIPLLVAAIKELTARVQTLEAK